MKQVSVIVASRNAETTIEACLSSLASQNHDGAAEIIVVDQSQDRSAAIAEERFPGACVVRIAEPRLIPELWGEGARRATGEVVAFTTAHCVPDRDWIAEILHHHATNRAGRAGVSYAGVGGAIEQAPASSLTQWAIYFCRYAPYMLPFAPRRVRQIPGDNASYKRWVLTECADLIERGFWETEINDRLCERGHELLLTPRIRVWHVRSGGALAFCHLRLVHGRLFGATRSRIAPPIRRLGYLGLMPWIAPLTLARITAHVLKKGPHRRQFVLSLPLIVLFACSWALGECVGYVSALLRPAALKNQARNGAAAAVAAGPRTRAR